MDKEILEKSLIPSDGEDGELYKDNTPFYRLASPYSAKIEGQTGKVSIFLIFAIIWTVVLIGIIVANVFTSTGFETAAIIIICFFACLAAGFLVFGIIHQKRILYANREEQQFLKNCLCTDGRIDKYTCVSRRSGSGKNAHVWYDVSMTYSYVNLSYKTVTDTYKATYGCDPEFYKGQYLMIAFNADKSYILSKFNFKKEDEKQFFKNEAARSDDDFDGLDGKPIKCNPKEKVKSAELPYMWFWAAFAVAVFMLAYTIPISILVVPQLISVHVVPAVIGTVMVYFLPAILTAAIVYMLTKYFKSAGKLKRILKNEPKFTRGKIFASEKTYREGAGKRVIYCYVDDKGEKHTEVLQSPYYRKTVEDKIISAIIAYDKNGNSVPLH